MRQFRLDYSLKNIPIPSRDNYLSPQSLELKPFEKDVIKLLGNIKFQDTKGYFQDTLPNDLKKINSSDKMFVLADKTRNICETSLDTYNKILHDNITKK